MNSNLQNWLAKVLTARARLLTRVAPIEPRPSPVQERDAIERAAAALLEWEHATAASIEEDGCVVATRVLVRIGDDVYNGQVHVARQMKGAWYKPTQEKGRTVWGHINPEMGSEDAELVMDCERAKIRER